MDPSYAKIYADLLEHFRNPANEAVHYRFTQGRFERAQGIVLRAVDQAKLTLPEGRRLRSDGEYFLLLSLHQTVVLPLVQDDSPAELNGEVEELISQDAESIVKAAASIDEQRLDIPASHILWGAARVLNKLNLKSWRLWERDDR